MNGWFDAHNHLQDPRLGDVAAEARQAGVIRCVVNATREEDWTAVAGLAARHPEFVVPSFGIHPWHAHTATDGWQGRLRDVLEAHPGAGIGEIGLDKWVDSPSIDCQMPVFLDQLRMARELGRPATIHCLKAWGPLFDALDRCEAPARFLMHSFNGSIETARRLLPAGAWFSCSGYFLREGKDRVLDVFRELPPDRILLETDAPDMAPPEEWRSHPLPDGRNHPANLPAIGAALAGRLGHAPEEFARLTAENARRFFGL